MLVQITRTFTKAYEPKKEKGMKERSFRAHGHSSREIRRLKGLVLIKFFITKNTLASSFRVAQKINQLISSQLDRGSY